MSNVKRFETQYSDDRMCKSIKGEYVLYADYEKLQAENSAIKSENGKLWIENDDLQSKLDKAIEALKSECWCADNNGYETSLCSCCKTLAGLEK